MIVYAIKQTNIFQEAPCLLKHVKCVACLSEAQEKAHRFKIKQIFTILLDFIRLGSN